MSIQTIAVLGPGAIGSYFIDGLREKLGDHLWVIAEGERAERLKEKGIAETLLEPRGAFAMDEYVIDSIGIGFETEEGKKLAQEVFNLSMWTLVEFFGGCSAEILMRIALEAMQSMYMFGMVYEMERLRMR